MAALSDIQIEIKQTLEEYESLKVVNSHVNEIENTLKSAYDKINILNKKIDKELKDIEDLEKIGVKSLFYKTLGNKESQLEKERQEYLDASLKYKELKQRIDLLEYERSILTKKLNQLPKLRTKIDELKSKREQEILASPNKEIQNEYREIVKRIDLLTSLKQELIEAIAEGEKSKKLLASLISFLKKAKNWGRWDMYSNDRHSKYMKHRAIDSAVKVLSRAQHQLNMFSRELRDINEDGYVFSLDNAQFNKFTDFFFDNLISDWIIQQRIRSSLHKIESTYDQVSRIILSIEEEIKTVKSELKSLHDNKDYQLLKS